MTEYTESTEGTPIPWWLVLLQGIAAVIIGVFLLTAPGITLLFLVQVLGFFWLIGGILGIMSIFIVEHDSLTGNLGHLPRHSGHYFGRSQPYPGFPRRRMGHGHPGCSECHLGPRFAVQSLDWGSSSTVLPRGVGPCRRYSRHRRSIRDTQRLDATRNTGCTGDNVSHTWRNLW